jgi:hypothetical protein
MTPPPADRTTASHAVSAPSCMRIPLADFISTGSPLKCAMQRSLDAHKQEMSLFTNHRNALNRRIQQGEHLVWLFCACAFLGIPVIVLMIATTGFPLVTTALLLVFGAMYLLVWLADHRAHPRRSGGFLFEKSGYVSTTI